jgi:hypothetical protein
MLIVFIYYQTYNFPVLGSAYFRHKSYNQRHFRLKNGNFDPGLFKNFHSGTHDFTIFAPRPNQPAIGFYILNTDFYNS